MILAAWVPIAAAASETCMAVNPQSVVDRAFISAMAASSIPHTRPSHELICYSDTDKRAVEAIRERAHSLNQPECTAFASSSDVAAVESALVGGSIRTWRESPMILCYLASDGPAIRNAINRSHRKQHDG